MAFNNFPYTDAHELNLDWIINKQKATAIEAEEALQTAREAESKVDNFIDNLDLQDAVDHKMDEMYAAGDFEYIFDEYQKLTGDVIIVTASFGMTQPRGSSYETIVPFTDQCKNRIETYTNRKCYIARDWGKAFHDDGFLGVLQAIENQVTEPNKVDVIMVAGGGNDITMLPDGETISKGDVLEGMQHFMAYCKTQYPNAIVRFAWLSWLKTYQYWRPQRDVLKVIGWYKELCGRVGIGYCTNSEYMYHQYYDDWYLGDNYHPSTLASTHIADGIMDCIVNGSTSVSRREELAEDVFITAAGATVTVNSCCPFLIVQENGVTTITPVLRSVNPAVKIVHNAAIFQISEGYEMPYYFNFNSHLFRCFVPINENLKASVDILALNRDGDTLTNKDMFSGYAGFYATYMQLGCVRTGLYQLNAYNEDWIYFPSSITLPTAYC